MFPSLHRPKEPSIRFVGQRYLSSKLNPSAAFSGASGVSVSAQRAVDRRSRGSNLVMKAQLSLSRSLPLQPQTSGTILSGISGFLASEGWIAEGSFWPRAKTTGIRAVRPNRRDKCRAFHPFSLNPFNRLLSLKDDYACGFFLKLTLPYTTRRL